jgi:cytochrome c oxidase subunit 2
VQSLFLLLAGCGGPVLKPAAVDARLIASWSWVLFAVAALIWIAVVVATLAALRRRDVAAPAADERRVGIGVVVATAATVLILIGLLIASVGVGRAVSPAAAPGALSVRITGFQWWWHIEYRDPVAGRAVTTANELHLPVGRDTVLELTAGDVIHSFWVPALHGKRDLIPGHVTQLVLRPDRPGTFRGQCAEFCGFAHAHMGLLVVAQPAAEFARWLGRQRRPAAPPAGALAARGAELFTTGPCALCHAVRGTAAGGRTGPDLTHIAGRQTLGAGRLPNTPAALAAWIVAAPELKPGAHMPAMALPPDQVQALVAYLGGLS